MKDGIIELYTVITVLDTDYGTIQVKSELWPQIKQWNHTVRPKELQFVMDIPEIFTAVAADIKYKVGFLFTDD